MQKYVMKCLRKALVLVIGVVITFIGTMDAVAYNLRSVFNAK